MSRYAGMVTRLAALTVDGVLMMILVPAVATGPSSLWEALTGGAPGWLMAGSQIVAALVPVGYFALCWWAGGQTLGNLLFGIVVRRPGGQRLGVIRAALRAIVGLAIPVLWIAGMLSTLWDSRRRALHDRIFDTVVCYKRREEGTHSTA